MWKAYIYIKGNTTKKDYPVHAEYVGQGMVRLTYENTFFEGVGHRPIRMMKEYINYIDKKYEERDDMHE